MQRVLPGGRDGLAAGAGHADAASPPEERQQRTLWPLVHVLLLVLLRYLFAVLLRPLFLVCVQEERPQDVRLLALAFLPAILRERASLPAWDT